MLSYCRDEKAKARTVVGSGEESLFRDPGSELRLRTGRGHEKERVRR